MSLNHLMFKITYLHIKCVWYVHYVCQRCLKRFKTLTIGILNHELFCATMCYSLRSGLTRHECLGELKPLYNKEALPFVIVKTFHKRSYGILLWSRTTHKLFVILYPMIYTFPLTSKINFVEKKLLRWESRSHHEYFL